MPGPGSRLGSYELVALLGRGGMGEVWLARDTTLGRSVALKLLPADLTASAERVARFEQEARLASALSHPNVCHIYGLGQAPDGERFIAMELVEGQSLRARLREHRPRLREVLDIGVQIAAGVNAAHAGGIIHRDLKPENVMIRPDGLVKVLDFGLAKLATAGTTLAQDESTRAVVQTDAGLVMGTLAYMSPEQARGQEVDARTDIWSAGVILYELVAGRTPFAAPSHSDILAAILQHEPDPLVRFDPHVPAELQRIVSKALRKDRTQRYQTTSDFLLDLQALREQHASAPPSSQALDLPTPETRSHPRRGWAALAAALILLAGGVAGWRYWSTRSAPDRSAVTARPATPGTLTRLTFAPGLQTDVSFSPDGRFIAYASDQGGNFDIWVQPVAAAGTPVRVTQSPAADTEPDWSPDGRQIVFRSERDGGGLFLVPALGGPERRVTSFGVRPKWSPDGTRIAFSSSPQQFASGLTFYVVGTDGRPPVALSGVPGEQLSRGCWHPDGRLTFLTESADGLVLRTRTVENAVSVTTTLPPLLRNVAIGNVNGEFTWAASGDALVFEIPTNSISHLWRLDVDPESLAAKELTQLSFGAGQDRRHALSRDGAKLAFSTVTEEIRLWSYPLDRQSGLIRGEPEPLTDLSAALPVTAALSPDGRRLVFPVTGIGTGQWELRVKDLQTGSSVRLFSDVYGRFLPQWSSDGTSLVYQRVLQGREGASASGILTVQRRPGADEEILAGPEAGFVTAHGWSPDGRAVLVSWQKAGPNTALAFWPLAGAPHAERAAEVIAADPAYGLWQGQISPNGQWLAFVAAAAGKALVCIVPSRARDYAFSRWKCISDPQVWTDKPRWSSDGRFLYVWRRSGSLFNVWAIPFDAGPGTVSGDPFQVTHFEGPSHRIWAEALGLAEPSVAAERMLLPVVHATGSVWMVQSGGH